MINKNKLFRYIHIYVSLFFLPCALLYALTGVCYVLGIDQEIGAKTQTISVEREFTKGQEREILLEILKENGIKVPSDTTLRPNKRGGGVMMGGVHYSITAKSGEDGVLSVSAKTRSLLGDLILLHKDKGAWYFSVLAVGFGVSLVLLYISGLMITLFASKKDRKPQLIVLCAGILACVILGYLSV